MKNTPFNFNLETNLLADRDGSVHHALLGRLDDLRAILLARQRTPASAKVFEADKAALQAVTAAFGVLQTRCTASGLPEFKPAVHFKTNQSQPKKG